MLLLRIKFKAWNTGWGYRTTVFSPEAWEASVFIKGRCANSLES